MKLFNSNKPRQLYSNLKPKERIDKILVEFLSPILEEKGFKYLKSKRCFKNKNGFFELHITWYGGKYNIGNEIVYFDMSLSIYSPKYRKWETEYYKLEENWNNSIESENIFCIKNWDKEMYELGEGYDLVKYDNYKLANKIVDNIKLAGFNFFKHFSTLDSAIEKLKEEKIKNLEVIIDLFIIQNKWKEAYDFFQENKQWHEREETLEGNEPDSQYSMNRRFPFELRKEKLKNWLQ